MFKRKPLCLFGFLPRQIHESDFARPDNDPARVLGSRAHHQKITWIIKISLIYNQFFCSIDTKILFKSAASLWQRATLILDSRFRLRICRELSGAARLLAPTLLLG